MQNNTQLPLFAPASQSGPPDDFDLNEIFADYFINEFDDPLNAYTSSMANFGGAVMSVVTGMHNHEGSDVSAPTVAPTEMRAAPLSLPTGGIRTAFHAKVPAAPIEPPEKRMRHDANTTLSTQQNQIQFTQQQTLTGVPNPMAGSALTQALHQIKPQQEQHEQLQQQMQQHQQQLYIPQPQTGAAQPQVGPTEPQHPGTQQANVGVGRVALPVGVGIRLGGVGGVAPATAQATARPPPVPSQFVLWGANNNVAMSDQAIAERRQRNREHAKRSRVRKKFMLESLQQEVRELQKENNRLRMLVQEQMPEDAMKIISECCTSSPLFDEKVAEELKNDPNKACIVRADLTLMNSLAAGQKCFVLSDPKLPDNPIIFASPDFYKLTGYTSKEVLGRNCRFLQGPATDPRAVDIIRKAIASGSDATVCILNYKADGTPFWNNFFIAALRDSDNCIVNYVGVQCEVEPDSGSSALEERVNAVLPLQTKDDKGDFSD